MKIRLSLLNGIARAFGIPFIYSGKLIADDLKRASKGVTMWSTDNPSEAVKMWHQTLGEPHVKGTHKFVIEAILHAEGGKIKAPRKDERQLELPYSKVGQRGVPSSLPGAQDAGSEPSGESDAEVAGPGGSEEGRGPDPEDAAGSEAVKSRVKLSDLM